MNVLIVSSSEGIAIGLLRCLSLMHAKAFVISVWGTSQASKLSRYCSGYRSCPLSGDPRQLDELTRAVNTFCRENSIDVVMPAGILGTFALAKIKAGLDCKAVYPTPSAEQIRALHNKWEFHQLLEKFQVPAPATHLIENTAQLQSPPLAFPFIVKPLALGNGEGVLRVDSAAQLDEYLANGARSRGLPLLVQEFVPGNDIVFGILAKDGKLLAWTIHERKPDWLRFFPQDRMLELGRKIVAAYNFSGAANFDVRFDEQSGRMAFLECNPRFWASTPLSVYYGVDFIRIGILAAQGKPLPKDCRTGVSHEKNVPYPTPRRYLKGLMSGDYPLRRFKRDLAWQSLVDPLPTIKDVIWDKLHLINLYDSVVIEQMS